MTALAPMMSSAKGDWCTPAEVVELVRQIDWISLDPCWNPNAITDPVKGLYWPGDDAELEHYDPQRIEMADGLEYDWAIDGLVFVNPEYGRGIGKWIDKCYRTTLHNLATEIVLLVPSRTDTRWFQKAVRTCECWAAWRGRLTFLGAKSAAPFPSALFYWGYRPEVFRNVMETRAHVFLEWVQW